MFSFENQAVFRQQYICSDENVRVRKVISPGGNKAGTDKIREKAREQNAETKKDK